MLGKKERGVILIIEKNDSTRRWLQRHLEKDFSLILLDAFVKAMDVLKKRAVDLIIVDYFLSRAEVIGFCQDTRKKRKWKKIPILAMTSCDHMQTICEVFEAGATDFLPRPLNLIALSARIRLLLNFRENAEKVTKIIEKFKSLSERDPLTNLYNRYVLEDRVKELIDEAYQGQYPLSIFMVDIDHFKEVNDVFGHFIGDEILSMLSDFFRKNLRKEDLIIRYGGEEFLIFLPNTSEKEACIVAGKLCKKVWEHVFQTKAGKIKITISIGGMSFYIDSSYEDENKIQDVLNNVDEALYEAKKRGRNQSVVVNSGGR